MLMFEKLRFFTGTRINRPKQEKMNIPTAKENPQALNSMMKIPPDVGDFSSRRRRKNIARQ